MTKNETVRTTISMPGDLVQRVESFWHTNHLASYSEAIRMLLEKSLPAFTAQQSIETDPARYLPASEPTVVRRDQRFWIPSTPLLYLRLIPTESMQPLKRVEAAELIRNGEPKLEPLTDRGGAGSWEPNEQGAIAFDAEYSKGMIHFATQLFRSRELWGVNSILVDDREILSGAVEKTFRESLLRYIAFADRKLGVKPPIRLEAGITGIKGGKIHVHRHQSWGPLLQDVRWTAELLNTEPASIDAALLSLFEEIFDAVGKRRPEGLNGFPAADGSPQS